MRMRFPGRRLSCLVGPARPVLAASPRGGFASAPEARPLAAFLPPPGRSLRGPSGVLALAPPGVLCVPCLLLALLRAFAPRRFLRSSLVSSCLLFPSPLFRDFVLSFLSCSVPPCVGSCPLGGSFSFALLFPVYSLFR